MFNKKNYQDKFFETKDKTELRRLYELDDIPENFDQLDDMWYQERGDGD